MKRMRDWLREDCSVIDILRRGEGRGEKGVSG